MYTVQEKLSEVLRFRPDIVFLQIGSNDLSNGLCNPSVLAHSIVSLAERIVLHGAKRVIIGQILWRDFPSASRCQFCWDHMGVTLPTYNHRVGQTNEALANLTSGKENLVCWHHHGFWNQEAALISADGVHLNEQGMTKYAFSVRRSILKTRVEL